ncbi:MAG: sodium ion-translocating decarboxylase subunit beta [Betaproteobacteria bacterium]|jgi:oxaloacetate decarboxylase beta subunit|nr:sodium ion-translocating decarboxylase subunit beta [Betaproteobacteria bacterium]MBK7081120.1 sodium ion-translocating decarboxylase subunit beta [Betaproteobacteria bacterium]MBK7590002.1 sodium ion-translocating decarboxylase subunit beta [Betaproteobacteria bacterium]MBK8687177.1 sodium ion-translocating decarboxylase subunit beta [Betaproteobacteria bacterium]MBL0290363.1 sodium ion-translocating decarboxylase subunit beta [Betaproteobacteria bacterium]
MISADTFHLLLQGVANVSLQSVIMILVAFVLLYLGIVKDYEPLLLVPIGAGCMLANLPLSPLIADEGMLKILYHAGIGNELFPLLIFIGIGALTDFGPLLENPRMVLLGAAGQFGIFLTLLAALLFGFSREEAASIGIIGAIDGPTSIYVSGILAPHLLGPITVAAYSYMSLVPVIMPPMMYLLTTKKERAIRMEYSQRKISRRTRIIFPIVVTVVVGTLVPFATPLIGMLMLGNLMKESGAVERLTKASSQEIANIVTLFLGLAIGSTMVGADFLKLSTLAILVLGIFAFALDTAAGILFGKVLNLLSGGKFNPLIGAAGISAFPMAARVVQRVAQKEDFENFVLMHAMGANAAGQVASVVAGGVLLALMGAK